MTRILEMFARYTTRPMQIDRTLMGATLANQGVNPTSGERAIDDAHVEPVPSFSAGTMVGELAFIDGERRSASVVAQVDVECYVFEAEDFLRLQESPAGIHAELLRNISASLAAKLRRANHSVSVLSAQMR